MSEAEPGISPTRLLASADAWRRPAMTDTHSTRQKICGKCRESKPESDYPRIGRHSDKFRSVCKTCVSLRRRANYIQHAEERKAYRRVYYVVMREQALEYARSYRKANPGKVKATLAASRIKHPNRKNKPVPAELQRERNRAYYLQHRAAMLEKNRRFKEANPLYWREWNNKNIESRRDSVTRRRVRLLGVRLERFSREEIFARDCGRCHVCGKKVTKTSWHLDHLIPLSRGGVHSKANVAVACPHCNLQRNAYGPAQLRLDV